MRPSGVLRNRHRRDRVEFAADATGEWGGIDPATGTFGLAGSLAKAWIVGSATLLPDGRVLVFGHDGTLTTAAVWSP